MRSARSARSKGRWWLMVAAGLVAASGEQVAAAADAPERTRALPPGPEVRQAPLPDTTLGYAQRSPSPTFAWLVLQLVPSPELAFGGQRRIDGLGVVDKGVSTAFGLRWQLTPLLWSFGVNRHQSRWRYFVVDPTARHSGSIELSTAFEYIGGHVDRVLARPGLRVYLPIAQKGEYLSASLGTSVYGYDGLRVAYDVGVYTLSGFLGLQVTVAPAHAPLTAITTLRIRFF